MNKISLGTIIIVLVIVISAVSIFTYRAFKNEYPVEPDLGGNSIYSYAIASSTTFASTKVSQVKTGQTILGYVTIASSSAASFQLKNATSTTDIASTTIVSFPAAADEMTYSFDLAASRGLIIESSSGFNGQVVITYK